MLHKKSYPTNKDANIVFRQTLRALDENLAGIWNIKYSDKNRKESKLINCEEKSIDYSKHKKNKSIFDSSLSFDVKMDFKPQVRQINHKNYQSNMFKNYEYERNTYNPGTKSTIKTFEQIKRLNPEIDFIKQKVDLSQFVRESKNL